MPQGKHAGYACKAVCVILRGTLVSFCRGILSPRRHTVDWVAGLKAFNQLSTFPMSMCLHAHFLLSLLQLHLSNHMYLTI